MGYEMACTFQESILQNAAENTRNKLIHDTYQMIATKISHLIDNNFNRSYNKFVHLSKEEITSPNILQAFYTPFCSIKLIVRRAHYVIVLTVSYQSLRAGHGVTSTELLRVAFEATHYDREGLMIEDALEIKVDNSIEAIYKQKVEEREDRRSLQYYNQRMGRGG